MYTDQGYMFPCLSIPPAFSALVGNVTIQHMPPGLKVAFSSATVDVIDAHLAVPVPTPMPFTFLFSALLLFHSCL